MFMIISVVSNLIFYMDNKPFIDEVNKQTSGNPDLEWTYVEKQSPNPNAKSITLPDFNGNRFILFRLQEGDRSYHLKEGEGSED
mgnify:FL=1